MERRIVLTAFISVFLLLVTICVQFNASSVANHQSSLKQFEDWMYRKTIILNETAGINRINEPVDRRIIFEDGRCANASKEIRVSTEAGEEIPSQVYNLATYGSGYVKSANVVFQANCIAHSNATYYVYYGNPAATKPTYASDLLAEATDTNITVANNHYKASFVKEDPSWYGIPDWINYLYYKDYNPTENLAWADWRRILMTVINVPPYWFVPFSGPISGTNVSIVEKGPVFIEVRAELGEWPPVELTGVNSFVKTYCFYARIPWFLFSINLNLTGANYEHIQSESYLSPTALPWATYRTASMSVKTIDIRPDIGDVLDWDGSWIDAEKTNTTVNPVGIGFIVMNGTDPPYTGFRSDRSSIAPFQSGTFLEAHQKLAVYLHQGNYTVTEQLYKILSHPLGAIISVPEDYSSIQVAVNAANPGDMILVSPGIYREHVYVNKTVMLIGEDPSTTIIDNNETFFSGIICHADDVSVSGFTIQSADWVGIFIISRGCRIRGNIITSNRYGISASSGQNTIKNNLIKSNIHGIRSFGSHNSFSENTITNNTYGILINSSSYYQISGNNITLNEWGVLFSECNGSIVSGNQISRNSESGIWMRQSNNNKVYHNNFINNTNYQASFHESFNNTFDNGVEGNYWSDYNGTDVDQNGIGDIPYIIDGNYQDNFPLMGMFFDFAVTIEYEQIYHVEVISNSTVSNLYVAWWLSSPNEYLSPGDKFIVFNVSGEEGAGFCRVTIPRAVLNNSYVVLVDWNEVPAKELPVSNSTHAFLYFTYLHSTHEVIIVPEFPSTLILLLLILVTLAVAFLGRMV